MEDKICNIIAKMFKNFGYISLGCAIAALIEIGVFAEIIFLLILAVIVIFISYIAIRQIEHKEEWVGKKFVSIILDRPIKKTEIKKVDAIIEQLGVEVWDLCATKEDIQKA